MYFIHPFFCVLTTQPQPQQPYGTAPFTSGIFGASNQQQQNQQQQQQQPAAGTLIFGGGLFSQTIKPPFGGTGAYPASNASGFGASTAFGARPTNLFAQSAQQSRAPSAMASIDANNVYGSNSLVSQALNDTSLLHLKDDDKTKSTSPISNFSYTMRHVPRASPTISRLRGFANSSQDLGSSGTGG